MKNREKRKRMIMFISLHFLLLLYSFSSVFSKLAAKQIILSARFAIFYGLALGIMIFYALAWQQIIKHMELTKAYANKAVTVVWGGLLGCVFFNEIISIKQIIGMILVVGGVVVFAFSEEK